VATSEIRGSGVGREAGEMGMDGLEHGLFVDTEFAANKQMLLEQFDSKWNCYPDLQGSALADLAYTYNRSNLLAAVGGQGGTGQCR